MSRILLDSINNLKQDLSDSSSRIKDNINNIRDNKQIDMTAEQSNNKFNLNQ